MTLIQIVTIVAFCVAGGCLGTLIYRGTPETMKYCDISFYLTIACTLAISIGIVCLALTAI